jgi:phosphatidate cytidylyltransferase
VKPGFVANLARRVGTAAVALPILWAVFFLAPPLATVGLVGVAAALALFEFHGMLRARGIAPLTLPMALVAALAFAGPLPWTRGLDLLPAALVILLAAMLTRARELPAAVPAAAGSLLGALYVGSLAGTLASLRVVDPVEQGAWRILLLLAIVMGNDTFAYFTGSAIGRTKLAPLVSPGKTVEGTLGGLVGAVGMALLVRALGLPDLPVAHAIGLGLAVAVAATVGDLAESLFKRWAGVKDSGALFPGHGGMLDRLDSLLFGAPVLYHYFAFAA